MVCTLDRVIYEDRSAGFMIASFKTKDEAVPSDARSTFTRGDKMIRFTAVGYRLPTTGAIDVDLDGYWEKNKYGLQLTVDRCVESIPKTKDGITAYLSSGLIKGIGGKTAKLIVDAFGVKTLEVIEIEPQKLLTVKGITEKKLKSITDSYAQSKSIRDIVSYLSPYGVTVKKCARIQEEFGAQTIDILKNRPFELCSISGFGFKTVDEIARKTSCTPNDSMRIRGALQFTLEDSMTAGHLYLGKETLRNKAHELLNAGYEREVVTLEESTGYEACTLHKALGLNTDEDDSVRMFDSAEQAKSWLIMQGVTEEELSVMTFLESCGTCRRCGSPLFPSLLKKDGYTYQCFTCDEDFYAFEQND